MNTSLPWATLGVWLLTLVVAIVGGAVVIWGDPGALSFQDYVKVLGAFAVGHGLLGIGRGVKAGLENAALNQAPIVTELPEARYSDAKVSMPLPQAQAEAEQPSSHV